MTDSVFRGIIIEESLEKKDILAKVLIRKTEVEKVTPEHQTSWIEQWTMHAIEVPSDEAAAVAREISQSLDSRHNWYADFKNDRWHYIVFRGRVFKVDRSSQRQYDQAKKYGISLGIPVYQVDFHPTAKEWNR